MVRLRLAFPVLAAASSLLLLGAAPALASTDHTVSLTQNVHGAWSEDDVNPCTGDPMTVNYDGNMVFHITYFTGSDEAWGTFTETGAVSAADNGVTYSGHATAWGNFNQNERNGNSEFTLDVRVLGSDGSEIIAHEIVVWVVNANGNVTATFDKLNLTCA